MNSLAASRGIAPRLAFVVILGLAGLLIFYHLTMLRDLVMGHGLSRNATFNGLQGALRIAIIVSLTAVAFGIRQAIWAMWASIGGLIATHYWAHLGYVSADFTAGRDAWSYLKGLIIPSIITTAFFYRKLWASRRPDALGADAAPSSARW